jgi:hypothetical protein
LATDTAHGQKSRSQCEGDGRADHPTGLRCPAPSRALKGSRQMNSKAYARDEQEFVRALQEAIDARDEPEAARLVTEHTAALTAFLERQMMKLEFDLGATLH